MCADTRCFISNGHDCPLCNVQCSALNVVKLKLVWMIDQKLLVMFPFYKLQRIPNPQLKKKKKINPKVKVLMTESIHVHLNCGVNGCRTQQGGC